MADSLYRQLLSQSRQLAKHDPRRPKQGNLRRAISAAYYAYFHFLIHRACECMLGTSRDSLPFRGVIARGFQHETMVASCKSFAGSNLPANVAQRLPMYTVSTDLRVAAQTFVEMQEKRHLADYDLQVAFSRTDVLAKIRSVEQGIEKVNSIRGNMEGKFFLMCLSTWKTVASRK